MKNNFLKKIISTLILMMPMALWAQVPGEKSTFPLVESFVVVVVGGSLGVIGLIIYVFMKHINAFFKILHEKSKNEKAKTILILVSCSILIPAISSAQNQAASNSEQAVSWYTTENLMFILLMAVYFTLLLIVLWISRHFMRMVKQLYATEKPVEVETEKTSWLDKVLDAFNASVPLHKEKDVLLNHDYDGIKELDNSLPPWWLYGFYVTIVFAVVYLFYFHLGGPGLSSAEAYTEEVRLANEQLAAIAMSKPADANVDENNIQLQTDEASLADAKSIFKNVCASCHGAMGEGGAGPNLTDEYWIHGGSINEVYHVLKTGVADKGMPQWSATYKPVDLQKLSSYVMLMKGSNPPNQKEPQGVLYQPATVVDSAQAGTDTATVK